MLAIFTAVRAEHEAVARHLTVLDRRQTDEGHLIWVGDYNSRPVLTCRTGMGEERVRGVVARILEEYPISAVISARLASGVPADLRVADLAICQKNFLCRDPGVITEPTGESDFRLMETAGRAATSARIRHMVGNCLTVSPLRPQPLDREALAGARSTVVVDTEGFWIAEAAFAHDLPYLAVRASLGDVYDRAPEAITMVGRKSSVTPWRFLRQAVAHPAQLPNLLMLADAVRRASGSLSRFFAVFLREMAEQPLPTPDRAR